MKLYALLVLHKDSDEKVKILQNEFNLQSFSFYQRRHVREFLAFAVETAVERTAPNVRSSIDLTERVNGMIHLFVRSDGLASALVSSPDYPPRVAHTLLQKVMNEFAQEYPSTTWRNLPAASGKMSSLGETLVRYENPQEADPFMNLQKTLDETRDILIITIDKVLKRGEDLDDLLAKTDKLSFDTQEFVRRAKRHNRCCHLF